MAVSLPFSPNCLLNSPSMASAKSNIFGVPCSFLVPCWSFNSNHKFRLSCAPYPKASSEAGGIPNELMEDSKFVPLNAEEPSYGPPALLLLGFEVQEASKIQKLLTEMGGEFLKVIFCTEDMINRSLWDAMHTEQPDFQKVQVAKSVPRICFLSGLSGEEMMMFIDAFPEAGLEPAVFAALVPNGADKPLQELIEEIMGDHEKLAEKRTS